MRSKAKLIAVIAVIVVIAVGITAFFLWPKGGSAEGSVYVQPISALNCANTTGANRFSGVIENQKVEKIKFDSSKQLDQLLVSEGDHVKEGDPLFTYDTASIQLDIQQAELEVERLKLNVSNDNASIAQLQKDIQKVSGSEKLGYSAQIQELQAAIAQAEYDIKSKQAEIEKLKASLNNASVTATIGGTVTSVADLSSILNGTSYDSSGNMDDTYITIMADGDFRVKGTVSESNIYDLYEGASVIVRSRVFEDQIWYGTIGSIETTAEENNNNYYYSDSGERASKYPFYVNMDSTDGLMLGQHVTIELDYGQSEAKDGIWLNSGWIINDGESAYVWAAKSEGAKLDKRTITLGEYDENLDAYQIASGLETSDFLAWPDVDCVEGAATTTEMPVYDDFDIDEGYAEDSYVDESYSEDSYVDESYSEDSYVDESYAADSDINENVVDDSGENFSDDVITEDSDTAEAVG